MNWRRGAWRTWLALTVVWIALVGGTLWVQWDVETPKITLSSDELPAGSLDPKQWTDEQLSTAERLLYWKLAEIWAPWAIVPPIALLVAGMAVAWVVRGFRAT
jgi:hypothetical protein